MMVSVTLTQNVLMLPFSKHHEEQYYYFQMDLFKFVPSLGKVNFVESYENKQAKKEEKPPKPAAAEKKSK